MKHTYELTFSAAQPRTRAEGKFPRYKRNHATLEAARTEARRVSAVLDQRGETAWPVIYGPDSLQYTLGGRGEMAYPA